MLHDILNFLLHPNTIYVLMTGAFGFASIIVGVAFATRKKLVIRRTKLEVKERIKIESHKEIILAIKEFQFAIKAVRIKICSPLFKVISDLDEVKKGNYSTNLQRANAVKYIISVSKLDNVSNECEGIEKFIGLIEYDLTVNGEDELIRGELDKLEIMLDKIKNMRSRIESAFGFNVTTNNPFKVFDELESIMIEYPLYDENDEVQAVPAVLVKRYMEKINESA